MAVQLYPSAIADRSWMPSFGGVPLSVMQDVSRRIVRGEMPDGFPNQVNADMAWPGETYQDQPERYQFQLSEADIEEIEGAVEQFKGIVAHAALPNQCS